MSISESPLVAHEKRFHVAIGITTCNRLGGLERLLNGIESLTFVKVSEVVASVVVVENGAKRGAEDLTKAFSKRSPNSGYHYVHEPVPGIPFARNAVLTKANEIGATAVAFIDDDEFPDEFWLDEAVHAMETFDADVVAGPVLPIFPKNTANWLRRGGGFERSRWPTGKLVKNVLGGNVLFKLTTPAVAGKRFLEEFPLSGGEDTIFFRQLRKQGARMVWCDSAIAYEEVGENRATFCWPLWRAYRLGTNTPAIEAAVNVRSGLQVFWCLFALWRINFGLFRCITGIFRGRAGILQGCRMIARGCGVLSGAFGHQFEEYKNRHSSK